MSETVAVHIHTDAPATDTVATPEVAPVTNAEMVSETALAVADNAVAIADEAAGKANIVEGDMTWLREEVSRLSVSMVTLETKLAETTALLTLAASAETEETMQEAEELEEAEEAEKAEASNPADADALPDRKTETEAEEHPPAKRHRWM